MVKVIGLGDRGCGVAEEFHSYPEYRIYKINSDIKERASLSIEKNNTIEEYEQAADPHEIGAYLRSVKQSDEVLFILGGGEPITGISLVVLEQIKDAHITVAYVRPDREVCTSEQKRDDKIVFNILQEYARSGLFDRLFLIDALTIEELVGDVSIKNYEKSINNFIAYVFAMVNFYNNSDAVLSNKVVPADISRIGTFGVASLDPGAEVKYLFPLEEWQDAHYYYGIPAKQLEENNKLVREIKKQTKDFSKEQSNNGFSVHSTTFDDIMVLCALYTKDIQKVGQ